MPDSPFKRILASLVPTLCDNLVRRLTQILGTEGSLDSSFLLVSSDNLVARAIDTDLWMSSFSMVIVYGSVENVGKCPTVSNNSFKGGSCVRRGAGVRFPGGRSTNAN